MLFIFDIDDTLVDTSATITPYRVQKALQKLVEKGLVTDLETASQEMAFFQKKARTSKEALQAFFQKHHLPLSHLTFALDALYKDDLAPDTPVRTTPFAVETLQALSSYPLYIVSKGYDYLQHQKLEKAGIDTAIFCKILIDNVGNKGLFYQKILNENPSTAVMVGDQVEGDLLPAKKLGLWTVHMRWGRGVIPSQNPCVDFQISELKEMLPIVPMIEGRV